MVGDHINIYLQDNLHIKFRNLKKESNSGYSDSFLYIVISLTKLPRYYQENKTVKRNFVVFEIQISFFKNIK